MNFYPLTVLLLFQINILQCVDSSWWSISTFDRELITHANPKILCEMLPRNKKQRRMCESHFDLILGLSKSTRITISECQHQFRFEKWNCSVVETDPTLFRKDFVKGGSRELSFVQAMASSSAVHSTLKACSTGYFACECTTESDESNEVLVQADNIKWNGCIGNNVDFSIKFVRKFTNAEEGHRKDTKAKATLHNNRVGRETFLQHSSIACKCHGLSGSCTMRTCWRLFPNVREISTALKDKYNSAIKITLDPAARIIPVDHRQKKPSKLDLVYYEDSPDYCSVDMTKGLVGTGLRICNETSEGPDSCDILCCGKGYESHRLSVTTRCECSFIWCCEVKCKICHEWKAEARCKPAFTQLQRNPPSESEYGQQRNLERWYFPRLNLQEK